jgi:hypothetical protein
MPSVIASEARQSREYAEYPRFTTWIASSLRFSQGR